MRSTTMSSTACSARSTPGSSSSSGPPSASASHPTSGSSSITLIAFQSDRRYGLASPGPPIGEGEVPGPTYSSGMRLQLVGGGRMGEALLAGLLAAGWAEPADIGVVEKLGERRDALAAQFPGVAVIAEPEKAD